jgi:hypothetical protein
MYFVESEPAQLVSLLVVGERDDQDPGGMDALTKGGEHAAGCPDD